MVLNSSRSTAGGEGQVALSQEPYPCYRFLWALDSNSLDPRCSFSTTRTLMITVCHRTFSNKNWKRISSGSDERRSAPRWCLCDFGAVIPVHHQTPTVLHTYVAYSMFVWQTLNGNLWVWSQSIQTWYSISPDTVLFHILRCFHTPILCATLSGNIAPNNFKCCKSRFECETL